MVYKIKCKHYDFGIVKSIIETSEVIYFENLSTKIIRKLLPSTALNLILFRSRFSKKPYLCSGKCFFVSLGFICIYCLVFMSIHRQTYQSIMYIQFDNSQITWSLTNISITKDHVSKLQLKQITLRKCKIPFLIKFRNRRLKKIYFNIFMNFLQVLQERCLLERFLNSTAQHREIMKQLY